MIDELIEIYLTSIVKTLYPEIGDNQIIVRINDAFWEPAQGSRMLAGSETIDVSLFIETPEKFDRMALVMALTEKTVMAENERFEQRYIRYHFGGYVEQTKHQISTFILKFKYCYHKEKTP